MWAYQVYTITHSGCLPVGGYPQWRGMVTCSWGCPSGLSTLTQGHWSGSSLLLWPILSVCFWPGCKCCIGWSQSAHENWCKMSQCHSVSLFKSVGADLKILQFVQSQKNSSSSVASLVRLLNVTKSLAQFWFNRPHLWLIYMIHLLGTDLRAAESKWWKTKDPANLKGDQTLLSFFSASIRAVITVLYNDRISATDSQKWFFTFKSLLNSPLPQTCPSIPLSPSSQIKF